MEGNFHGDLADVVRGGAVASAAGDHYNFPENYDQFQPLDPTRDGEFGDPFSNMRDPFLAELDGIGQRSSPACGSFEGSNGFRGDRGMLQTTPFRISCDSGEMVGAACAFAPMRTCDLQGFISGDISTSHPSMSMESSLIDTARVQICSPRNSITNKRKIQAKKVVCIPAPTAAAANSRQGGGEVVPSDLWAWRKYGQKPIKGSPYPRGYYRCSSSKGCSARKQVERSRTDPNMLVITYTSEHSHPWPTHRNSLAGSTRLPSKPDPQETATLKKEEITSSSINEDENGQEDDCNKGLNNVITDQQTMKGISSDYNLFDDLRDFEANTLDPFGSLFDN